eukprot:TRINITY_DN2106_c0_g1_i1.p1 TRINITY_DN2106_c0_g1~~TRINITY_DN2106_c0_g1_i1.p1  ORF type:complete len:502 (-),score=139.47 TRINITY_DN2106_c0_g1_i1:19-1524(-)
MLTPQSPPRIIPTEAEYVQQQKEKRQLNSLIRKLKQEYLDIHNENKELDETFKKLEKTELHSSTPEQYAELETKLDIYQNLLTNYNEKYNIEQKKHTKVMTSLTHKTEQLNSIQSRSLQLEHKTRQLDMNMIKHEENLLNIEELNATLNDLMTEMNECEDNINMKENEYKDKKATYEDEQQQLHNVLVKMSSARDMKFAEQENYENIIEKKNLLLEKIDEDMHRIQAQINEKKCHNMERDKLRDTLSTLASGKLLENVQDINDTIDEDQDLKRASALLIKHGFFIGERDLKINVKIAELKESKMDLKKAHEDLKQENERLTDVLKENYENFNKSQETLSRLLAQSQIRKNPIILNTVDGVEIKEDKTTVRLDENDNYNLDFGDINPEKETQLYTVFSLDQFAFQNITEINLLNGDFKILLLYNRVVFESPIFSIVSAQQMKTTFKCKDIEEDKQNELVLFLYHNEKLISFEKISDLLITESFSILFDDLLSCQLILNKEFL